MEINIKYLSIQNPWWSGGVLKYDPILENFDQQELKFRSKILDQVVLTKDLVYILRGPRGCGKTIILKSIIRELIERQGVNPENVFYYSCHNISSNEQLNEIIKVFLAHAKERKNKDRLYVFIDEVTLVKHWERGIEYLRRAGMLKNVEVFLSGSMLSEKKISAEYLQNKVYKEITVPALSFSEFLILLSPELAESAGKKVNQDTLDKLEYYLDIYFLTGGFMAPINNYKAQGSVKQPVYSNYIYWLIADIAKMGRDLVLFRQVLEKIIFNLGRPLGYKTIAHRTKAKTHLTVEEYIKILEKMFVVKVLYQAGNKERSGKSKAKKIFFVDPFIFWTLYSYIYGSLNYWQFSRTSLYQEDIFVSLVKNLVFCHLEKECSVGDLTFWRDNAKKKEIDFLIKTGKQQTPILVSYNNDKKDAEKKMIISSGFPEGIIVSKNEIDLSGKIKIMPLGYFLLNFKQS